MRKNKAQLIGRALGQGMVAIALHPFLTFLAGFVAAIIIAAAIFAGFNQSLAGETLLFQSGGAAAQKKIETKRCDDVFAIWEQRKTDLQNFSQTNIKDSFKDTSSSIPSIDQTQE